LVGEAKGEAEGSLTSAIAWYDSRLRKQQDELKIADQNKNEFLAVLGHELRNPLAPIRTGLELLERARTKPELLDTLQPMMDRQFSHLSRLVDDLLDFGRISRGDIALQVAPIDLNVAIGAAVEQIAASIHERQHDIVVAISGSPLTVLGDFDRLTQIVVNLLSNASKYSEPGSRITVTSRAENDKAVVSVVDDGFGIPPRDLEKVFELFTQIPEHRKKTGGGGLGIGLALARRLTELHNGSIKATSQGLGHGSEFVIDFPLSHKEQKSADRNESRSDRYGTSFSRRVLIVDDNTDAATSMGILLQEMGHDTCTAHDAQSALTQMELFKPEIVLLDLGLPRLDGVEVGRRMRTRPEGGDVTLIAVTGWSQDHDRRRTAEAGFDGHLVKPITAQQIQSVIAQVRHSPRP
jgi:CheY-like chemotaxis protein